MKLELHILEDFGPHPADGSKASEYRFERIDPYVDICKEIVLDFTGVRNANSSFMNALVTGLIQQHGTPVLGRVVFKGCNPIIRVLAEGAISLGIQKAEHRIDA